MTLTRRRLPVTAGFAAPKTDPEADRAGAAALRRLITGNPTARQLNEKAVAVLVFPKIVKVAQDIYAFIFAQNGLMAGFGIEGSKITKI
jgi:hypothetical protein